MDFYALIPLSPIESFKVSPPELHMVAAMCHQLPLLSELAILIHPEHATTQRRLAVQVYDDLAYSLDCPELKAFELWLPRGDPKTFAPAQLIEMAAARASRGRPFHRVTITVTPTLSQPLELFETAFGLVAEYVSGETEIRTGVVGSSFVLNKMWEVPEAKQWWGFPE
ncbi:hypothetical protein FKP32DRAFT_1593661 [Trametes sanguinea]|nr:hypothetical protein FKP32DRAFT_1593661 [Trametes sanguinea]